MSNFNIWEQIAENTVIGSRRLHRCVYHDGYIYLTGGKDSDNTQKNDAWRSLDGINWELLTENSGWLSRSAHGFIYANGYFWIMGGSSYDGLDTTYYHDVWRSPDCIIWEQITGNAEWDSRHEFSVLEINGSIIIVGGFYSYFNEYVHTVYYSDAWKLDPGETVWEMTSSNIGIGVREHASVYFDNKIWIFGGQKFEYGSATYTNEIFYSEDAITWHPAGSGQWSARREHQAVVVRDNIVFIMGGYNDADGYLDDLWRSYDGVTWEKIEQETPIPKRSDFGFVYNGSRVYLILGYDYDYLSDVWASEVDSINNSDFFGSPLYGPSKLLVKFTSIITSGILVKWFFGDGEESREINPDHIYYKPGKYTVTMIASRDGVEYTVVKSNYITVYEFEKGLISDAPDKCFKLAVKSSQGTGIHIVSGTWVWPTLAAGVAKGFNELNQSISLVINAEDMSIYQIGIDECWKDREGSYGESDIESFITTPEITGESDNVRHVETKACIRPWDESYRGTDGYNSEGIMNGQEVTVEAYKGGEQIVPETTLQKVNSEGDYSLLKEVEARRFKLKIKFKKSAYKILNMITFFQRIANRTPPQNNFIFQKEAQKVFAGPDIWFSKNYPTVFTNRSTGEVCEGEAQPYPDMDGKQGATTVGRINVETELYDGDFTLSVWINGNFLIVFENDGSGNTQILCLNSVITYTDGTNTISLNYDTSGGWHHFAVVRSGSQVLIYVDGALRTSGAVSVVSFGGAMYFTNLIYDLRFFGSAISHEHLKLYNDYKEEFI